MILTALEYFKSDIGPIDARSKESFHFEKMAILSECVLKNLLASRMKQKSERFKNWRN